MRRNAGAATASVQRRWSSIGGPGSATTMRPAACSSRTPGAVPARPRTTAPSGTDACLRTPGAKSWYGLPRRLGERPGNGLDLALERLVHAQRTPGEPAQELDRAVVVGRPQPSRADADVRLEALGDRVGELLLAVAHDEDPAGIETQPHELGRDEGPVRVAPIPADELGTGDDDDGARTRRHVGATGTARARGRRRWRRGRWASCP